MSENHNKPLSKAQANQISGAAFVLRNICDNLGHAFCQEDLVVLHQALEVLANKKAELGSVSQG